MTGKAIEDETFHENIQHWARVNPKKAVMLQYLHDDTVHLCQTDGGVPNMAKEEMGQLEYFHDPKDPIGEAQQWFSSLNLRLATVIYVYGVGLGYYYDAAKSWLEGDPRRSIVFLEDDPAVLHCFFRTKRASALLNDPQAVLFHFSNLQSEEGGFEELYWDFVLTQMEITALGHYKKHKNERYLELKHKIVHDAAIKNALVEEYLRFGVPFFRNFYPNMLTLAESWLGTKLFGKFENIPAIICGAGPSLEKNGRLLSQYLDKAIVFGGGSALNALSSRGILPHFGIGIDPNPTQEYRLSTNKAYEVPFFYRNRLHAEAFKLIHGPRLYIPGAGGYEIADWFDEQFGLLDEIPWIDEGHNVVNFGMELALNLGCNPILFVGVDLAYTEMQSYASGIVENTSVSKDQILETDDFDTTALLKQDIYGRPIYTLWKWIAESEWGGKYAKEHPKLTIINCTEGGLGMPGIANMPLEEVARQYLTRSYDLSTRVSGEIFNSAMPHVTQEVVEASMQELADSLHRSIGQIKELIDDTERYKTLLNQEKEIPEVKQSGLAALAEIELEEEPAYQHIIGIFNLVYSRMLNKELQQLERQEEKLPEWERQAKKCDVNIKRLQFMHDLAVVNAQMIDHAIEERNIN